MEAEGSEGDRHPYIQSEYERSCLYKENVCVAGVGAEDKQGPIQGQTPSDQKPRPILQVSILL